MPDYGRNTGRDTGENLLLRVTELERKVRSLQAGNRSTWDRADRNAVPSPTEGQVVVQYDTNQPWFYADGEWRQLAGAGFVIKVVADDTVVTTGDGKFIFAIPEDLDGLPLTHAEAFVTTVSSSGAPSVQIRNVTDSVDMLSTAITIDASEFTSYTAATRSVIHATNNVVATGDRLAVDVDAAGTGAKGLGVILGF